MERIKGDLLNGRRNKNKGTELKGKVAWRKKKITNSNKPCELQLQPQT